MKPGLLPFLLLPLVWACGEKPADGPEPDTGFDICMFVNNPYVGDSGNMLDPTFRDEILSWGVTLTHDGETYPLQWPETLLAAEATDRPGFRVEPYIPGVDETPVMRFGALESGPEGLSGETFTIDWGINALLGDEVTFDFHPAADGNASEAVVRVWLNGRQQPEGSLDIEIVKTPMLPIIDYLNLDFNIFVKNAGRENLLDPTVEGNILDNEISVDYNGETWPVSTQNTRAVGPPQWRGLRIEPLNPYGDDSPVVLKFGEFPTGEHGGCLGEEFAIDWGDGTTNHVKFDCRHTYPEINPLTGEIVTPPEWAVKIWLDEKLHAEGLHPDYGLAAEIVK